jgi:putative membrane protein
MLHAQTAQVAQTTPAPGSSSAVDTAAYVLIAVLGAFLWWGSSYHPSLMPVWAPWEFSWLWFFAAALALWWYARGIYLTPKGERPAFWRILLYVIGVLSIYTVLQTHFLYLAEHMFFLNRVQHVVMHHFGPFLIAVAWPGASLYRGMPHVLQRVVDAPALARLMRVIQQPVIASVLFVGLVALWLVPSVHFVAMIDPKLYAVMNWSMVVDGVLFWILVLDPRPKPPAWISFGARAAIAVLVILPQILLGALLAFASVDLYSFYDWCGRIYPSISALDDQQFGGLIVWIPPAMMSVIALILVLNAIRLNEEKQEMAYENGNSTSAAAWTGR